MIKTALAAAVLAASVLECLAQPLADPASDAPEGHRSRASTLVVAPTYADALRRWRTPEHVNAWIGAAFEYDAQRALLLSETQRRAGEVPSIHVPEVFYTDPTGVCVDLARFAVETLRAIAPEVEPRYVMIEFDPITIAGNTLRRHWLVSFQRDGQRYYFADSKRPGHVDGPYASTQAFVDAYARYRQREIVSARELPSYQRRVKTRAIVQRKDGQ